MPFTGCHHGEFALRLLRLGALLIRHPLRLGALLIRHPLGPSRLREFRPPRQGRVRGKRSPGLQLGRFQARGERFQKIRIVLLLVGRGRAFRPGLHAVQPYELLQIRRRSNGRTLDGPGLNGRRPGLIGGPLDTLPAAARLLAFRDVHDHAAFLLLLQVGQPLLGHLVHLLVNGGRPVSLQHILGDTQLFTGRLDGLVGVSGPLARHFAIRRRRCRPSNIPHGFLAFPIEFVIERHHHKLGSLARRAPPL